MKRRTMTRIISGIVAFNMTLVYSGVLPFVNQGYFDIPAVSVYAAGVSYEVSGDTMTITGTESGAAVTAASVSENITDSVTRVIIGEGITSVKQKSFYGQNNIETVEISSTVTTIESEAFRECSNLKSVVLGESVSAIKYAAFLSCRKLASVTFPASVSELGTWAFNDCRSLRTVTFDGSVDGVTLGAMVFTLTGNNGVVKQNGSSSARILEVNEADASAVTKLKTAGMPDSWFTKNSITSDMLTVSLPASAELYNGSPKSASVTVMDGITDYGTLKVTYSNGTSESATAPSAIGDYTVYASFTGGENYNAGKIELGSFSIVPTLYSVTKEACTNGTVSVAKAKYGKGETVTVTVTPASGYFTTSVSYNDGTDHVITPVEGVYSFTMPEKAVTVKAVFAKPVKTAAVAATCTESGKKEYWTLAGVNYADAACTKKIADITTWGITAELGHNYANETLIKSATCTETGSAKYTCSRCDDVKTEELSAIGHSFDNGTVTKEATEDATGIRTYKCTNTGCTVTKTEVIEKKAHVHAWDTEFTVDKEPTCTTPGSKSVHCSKCDAKDKVTEIPAKGHTEGDWTVTKAATCTVNGSKEKKCTVCKAVVETEVIKAAGHTWNETATVDKAATCTEKGSQSVHCAKCNAADEETVAEIPAKGHTAGDWTVTKAATCTENGSKEKKCTVCKSVIATEVIKAAGHTEGTWSVNIPATCETAGGEITKCITCDEVLDRREIPAAGHKYGDWTVTKEATETSEGERVRECSVCKKTETETIPTKVHVHTISDWTVTKAATCETAGLEVKKCTDCGKVLDEKTIEAKGHTAGNWTVKTAATCEAAGLEVKKCTACEEVLDEKAIAAKGHSYGEFTVTKEATETEAGEAARVCSVCKHADSKVIPAKGHTHKISDWTVKTPVTCTSDGVEVKKCESCGEVLEEKTVAAAGHSFGNWTTVVPATCTTAGTQVRTCADCEAVESAEIPALGHKWDLAPTVDKEASCTEEGSQSIHCTACGEKKDSIAISITEHHWNEFATTDEQPTCTEEGIKSVHCADCVAVKDKESVSATGHAYGDWKVTKEATLLHGGEETQTCECCGAAVTRPTDSGVTVVKKVVKAVLRWFF